MKESSELIILDKKNTVVNIKIDRRATRKKSIAIIVTPNEGVVLRVPVFTKTEKIKKLVNKKESWILKSIEKVKLTQEEKEEYVNKKCYLLLGKEYRLLLRKVQIRREVMPKLINGKIVVKVPIFQTKEQKVKWIKNSLLLFYMKQANEIITKTVKRLSVHIGESPAEVKIKKLKSAWGICRENNISFNWRLVMARISLIEYVVAHEICHLKYKNHSKDFWSMLKLIQPDCKERRKQLNKISHLLDI